MDQFAMKTWYALFLVILIVLSGCRNPDLVSVEPFPNGSIISFSPLSGSAADTVTIIIQPFHASDSLGVLSVFWGTTPIKYARKDSSTLKVVLPQLQENQAEYFHIRFVHNTDTTIYTSTIKYQLIVRYQDTARCSVVLNNIGCYRENASYTYFASQYTYKYHDSTVYNSSNNITFIDTSADTGIPHSGLNTSYFKKGYNVCGNMYGTYESQQPGYSNWTKDETLLAFMIDSSAHLLRDITFRNEKSSGSSSPWQGGSDGSSSGEGIYFNIPAAPYTSNSDGSLDVMIDAQLLPTATYIHNEQWNSYGGSASGGNTYSKTLSNRFTPSSYISIHIRRL